MLLWHGIFSFSPCSFDMVYFYIPQFSFLLRFLEERFITQWNFYLWMRDPFESVFCLVGVRDLNHGCMKDISQGSHEFDKAQYKYKQHMTKG